MSDTQNPQLVPVAFARLQKFDEHTGYFEATAASEDLDRSGEVFDYAKSKPHFERWSQDFLK